MKVMDMNPMLHGKFTHFLKFNSFGYLETHSLNKQPTTFCLNYCHFDLGHHSEKKKKEILFSDLAQAPCRSAMYGLQKEDVFHKIVPIVDSSWYKRWY